MEEKKLLGERMFDAIENGAVGSMQWLQKQAQDDPDRYTDDMLRLLGGGVKNVGWALSKVPFLDKIAQGEDWLAGKAREMSEELTPQLDPRFAGWGTRIGTGILADKGIGKAIKGTKYLNKVGAAKLFDNIPAQAVYADEGLDVSTRMATAVTTQTAEKSRELRKVANQILWEINHPLDTKLPKLGKSTPETRFRQIFSAGPNDEIKYRYPSIEDLDLATRGPGNEALSGWKYDRASYDKVTDSKWRTIANNLQKKRGGTDAQKDSFVFIQKAAIAKTRQDIKILNKRFNYNYLAFAREGLEALAEEGIELGVENMDLLKGTPYASNTFVDQANDALMEIYTEMFNNIEKYPTFELGHIKSAKNVARQAGVKFDESGQWIEEITTADYASNLRAEIRRSIRDFKEGGTLIEAGNQLRKAHSDAPDIVNLLLGTSPNVDVEYMRHIGDFGNALENVIPFERQDHFMEYLRKGIRKWQGSEPGGLAGAYQLRFYRRELHKLIDNYLNDLRDGKFPEQLGKSDFEADSAIRAGLGKTKQDEIEAAAQAVIRGEKGNFSKHGDLYKK